MSRHRRQADKIRALEDRVAQLEEIIAKMAQPVRFLDPAVAIDMAMPGAERIGVGMVNAVGVRRLNLYDEFGPPRNVDGTVGPLPQEPDEPRTVID